MVTLELTTPKTWDDLTQEQIIYLARLMQSEKTNYEICLSMFIFCMGIKVLKQHEDKTYIDYKNRQYKISNSTFIAGADAMEWIVTDFKGFNPHFEKCKPLFYTFEGVSLRTFIDCENKYQAFIHTKNTEHLTDLAKIMFTRFRSREADLPFIAFMWFTGIKQLLGETFFNYYKKSAKEDDEDEGEELDMREYIFSTVRALTGGDVTKTDKVLDIDCCTALYELDQKAKEIFELEKLRKKR